MKGASAVSLAVALVAVSLPAAAQEDRRRMMLDEDGAVVRRFGLPLAEDGDYFSSDRPMAMEAAGMVRTMGGGWRPPTVDDALREIRQPWEPGRRLPTRLAYVILKQEREPRSPAELDAFAEQLVDLAVAEGGDVARAALAVFGSSVHEGAFERVLRYHGATASRTPPGKPLSTFFDLYRLEPQGRGRDILLVAIAEAEMPEPYRHWGRLAPGEEPPPARPHPSLSPWCAYVGFLSEGADLAAGLAFEEKVRRRRQHLEAELRRLPVDVDAYVDLWLSTAGCGAGSPWVVTG